MNRRSFLKATAAAALAIPADAQTTDGIPAKPGPAPASPWPLCLNGSTIRPTPLTQKISVAAEAGYDAIELWTEDLQKHEAEGGNLADVRKMVEDGGLWVPNVIGLWGCMPPDRGAFEKSLAQSRDYMRMAAAVGSRHAAAIPLPDRADFDLKWGAECYRELLRIGREEFGLKIAFEFVGFFKGVHRLGQACAVAIDADDPDACLIMDTFHLFRGGSGFEGIRHLNGSFIADFHWNDVPSDPPRQAQGDEHRLYPGEGILPLTQVLRDLRSINYTGPLSLELFRKEHYAQEPGTVAKVGLDRMGACVAAALATPASTEDSASVG